VKQRTGTSTSVARRTLPPRRGPGRRGPRRHAFRFCAFLGPASFVRTRTRVASDRSGPVGGRHGAERPEPVTGRACRCRPGVARGGGTGARQAGVTRAVRARAPMSTGPSAAARVSSFAPHDVGSGHTCSGRQKFVADSSRAEGARTYPCAKLHHPCNKNFYLPLTKKSCIIHRASQHVGSCLCRRHRVDMAI